MESFLAVITSLSNIIGVPASLCLAWAAFIIRDQGKRLATLEADMKEMENKFTSALKEMDSRYTQTLKEIDSRYTQALKEMDSRYTQTLKEMDSRYTQTLKEMDIRRMDELNKIYDRLNKMSDDVSYIRGRFDKEAEK